jgi:hypothetical protein
MCFFYCTRFSENQRDRSVGAVSTRLVVSSLVSSRGRVTHLTKFFLSCGLVSLYFTFFLNEIHAQTCSKKIGEQPMKNYSFSLARHVSHNCTRLIFSP